MEIKNVGIIAHVDHGKTTLVDRLFQQTGALARRDDGVERALDSNDLERERGITILAKTTAIEYQGVRINIVDTPGHVDFGGEVERILSMVDSVLLLVDAAEGPMPQTRFVTQKAFAQGLRPILVVNKIDRTGAEPHRAVDAVFDLFDSLGATEEQLDFPVVFTSATLGVAGEDPEDLAPDMSPLLDLIVRHVESPTLDVSAPFQMQISSLDYSNYVGVMGIGRVNRGRVTARAPVTVVDASGKERKARVLSVLRSVGLERHEIDTAEAGDIVCITGIDDIGISDTLCDPDDVEPLPALRVDAPTLTMSVHVNTSPLAGDDGKYLTSRQLKERLYREASHNVALRIAETDDADRFLVSGRGELHLSVLVETMRREGYELAVSKPEVIKRSTADGLLEPFEDLSVDVEEAHQGKLMQALGERQATLLDMQHGTDGRVRMTYRVATRAMTGLRQDFLTMTSGTGIMSAASAGYGPDIGELEAGRNNGVLVSNTNGAAVGYALFNLQNRGRLFLGPGDVVYEGMVVGIHSRTNDLDVNPTKEKKLTNIRAGSSDENILLNAPIRMSLEQSIDFINDDELLEVTPAALRIRKKHLRAIDRKRAGSTRLRG